MTLALLALAAAGEAPPAVSGVPGQGITLAAPDGRLTLRIQTRIVPRVDLTLPPPGGELPEEIAMRTNISTARLYLAGTVLTPEIKYLTQLGYAPRDYRDGTISPIFDAYLDVPVGGSGMRLRTGQYFVRYDRMRTVREFAIQMTDRPAVVSELALDRDVGLTLYDEHLFGEESPVALHLGAFSGRGIQQTAGLAPPGGLVIARVELRPLGPIDDDSEGDLENRAVPGLALGVGGGMNWNTNRVRSTTGPVLAEGTADYMHLAADGVFKWHGVALMGQVMVRELMSEPVGGERPAAGAVVQASYHLPMGLEPCFRYGVLQTREGADAAFVTEVEDSGRELGAGLVWYENGHRLKVQATGIQKFGLDWERNTFMVATQVDASF